LSFPAYLIGVGCLGPACEGSWGDKSKREEATCHVSRLLFWSLGDKHLVIELIV